MKPTEAIVPVVDACFAVRGEALPLDHGYALYSAITRLIPQFHERPTWGLHTIPGRRTAAGLLSLGGQSTLRVRLPASDIAEMLPLPGARLDIVGHPLSVGVLRVLTLKPAARLCARFVTVKGFVDPQPFSDALRRQIVAIEGLNQDPERINVLVGERRVRRIKDKIVVGYRVELEGLEADASIAIQRKGLGGRRHMGAGLFIPARSRP